MRTKRAGTLTFKFGQGYHYEPRLARSVRRASRDAGTQGRNVSYHPSIGIA